MTIPTQLTGTLWHQVIYCYQSNCFKVFFDRQKKISSEKFSYGRTPMKLSSRKNILLFLILSVFLISSIPVNLMAARSDNSFVGESSEVQLIEGTIKQFDPEKQTIVLQLNNGEKLTILVNWNTVLVGYTSPKEIEKGNKVKIWHSAASDTPKAVKIEKKLLVGC